MHEHKRSRLSCELKRWYGSLNVWFYNRLSRIHLEIEMNVFFIIFINHFRSTLATVIRHQRLINFSLQNKGRALLIFIFLYERYSINPCANGSTQSQSNVFWRKKATSYWNRENEWTFFRNIFIWFQLEFYRMKMYWIEHFPTIDKIKAIGIFLKSQIIIEYHRTI